MTPPLHRSRRARMMATLVLTTLATAVATPPVGAATSPVAKRNVSDKVLANEFLRLLKAKSTSGLRRFLSPGFLLQRPDGTFLTRAGYLANPAVVLSYKISQVKGARHSADVRTVRYTVVTDSIIDGKRVTNEPVARLSAYAYAAKQWQLVAHANFTAVPK